MLVCLWERVSSGDQMEAITGPDALKVAHDKSQRPETKIDDNWTAMGQRLGPNDKQPCSPFPISLYLYLFLYSEGTLSTLTCVVWCLAGLLPLIYGGINITTRMYLFFLYLFTLPFYTHLSSCRFLNGFQLWANFTLAFCRHHHRHKMISYFFLTIYCPIKTFVSFWFGSASDYWWIPYFVEDFRWFLV